MAAVLETDPRSPTGAAELPRTDAYYRLRADIEEFLYSEADLLDERRFRDWLNLLADDISYFMPIRRNVKFGQHADRLRALTGENESQRSGSGTHGGANPVDENRHGASIDGHTQLYSASSGTQNTMPPGWAASRRTRRNGGKLSSATAPRPR